jgi:hypothetical protein
MAVQRGVASKVLIRDSDFRGYAMSDVLLDDKEGDWLTLVARVVNSTSSDLMLDCADRRKGGGAFRRALVHDEGDALVLNYAGDYPAGVRVDGPMRLTGPLHVSGSIDGVGDVVPRAGTVAIRGSLTFEARGVLAQTDGFRPAGTRVTVDVGQALDALQAQVTALSNKVQALEARLNQ